MRSISLYMKCDHIKYPNEKSSSITNILLTYIQICVVTIHVTSSLIRFINSSIALMAFKNGINGWYCNNYLIGIICL